METIKIALDWSPNTIHSGLLLAYHQGSYRKAGLDVQFTSPETDDYSETPARRLASGAVDFAIAPTESVIAYQTSRNPVPLIAVAAILQRDTSAIVSLAPHGPQRPAELDGKIYASYKARFEDGIVRSMVKNDGGDGTFEPVHVARLNIWDMLRNGDADATWVFMPWEGVKAQKDGLNLNIFRLEDYQIPYGYTPLIVAHLEAISQRAASYQRFLKITAQAYQQAVKSPDHCAQILCQTVDHPDFSNPEFIAASLHALQHATLTPSAQWGIMQESVWQKFIDWLVEQQLLEFPPNAPLSHLFTNALLLE